MAASTKSTSARNRSAAARRTAAKDPKESTTEERPATTSFVRAPRPGETPDRVVTPGNARTHQANPKNRASSEVAHAPASGSKNAEGGYPAGEYDVTDPDAPPAPEQEFNATDELLKAHFAASGADMDALLKTASENTRLSDDQRQAALEAFPVGAIIEHEAPNRWRVHVRGQNRFGHGSTASEAVEAFILGNQGSAIEYSARAFVKLSPEQQQEIRDRDAAAASGGQGDATEFARTEALKAAQADKGAKPAALKDGSDGAQRASARNAAGKKGSSAARSARGKGGKGRGRK